MWACAAVLLVAGFFQLGDVYRSYSEASKLNVRFFDNDMTMPYEESDLPRDVDGWAMVGYSAEDRRRGSDLGLRSDSWSYQAGPYLANVSFDQTFPGWHELTTCYVHQGWILRSRVRKNIKVEIDGQQVEWPYIEAELEKKTGERGFLLFSFFDAFGMPIEAPAEWGTVNSFIIRARNRLPHRVRASLFRGEAYQIQVFVPAFGEISTASKAEITERFLKIRELVRDRFREKRPLETVAP